MARSRMLIILMASRRCIKCSNEKPVKRMPWLVRKARLINDEGTAGNQCTMLSGKNPLCVGVA